MADSESSNVYGSHEVLLSSFCCLFFICLLIKYPEFLLGTIQLNVPISTSSLY